MPTRLQYRQQTALEAGRFFAGTSTNTTMTTTTLIDNDGASSLKSTLSIDDLYTDYYLYLPGAAAADQVRSVSLYTPSTGTLTVDLAWSAAGVPQTVAYELHGMFSPDDIHTFVNDALKRCFVEVEITVTPTAQATRHDLTTANTWLTDRTWVRQVGHLTANEVRAEVDPYTGRTVRGFAEKLSNIVYLNHHPRTFGTNETIYVKCIKPAYFHCKTAAGVFGGQSGLTLETDEAVPTVEWVAFAALIEASRRGFTGPNAEARKLWSEREGRFARLYDYHRAKEFALPALTFRPVSRMGWQTSRVRR